MGLPNIKLVTLDATNTILKFRVQPWQRYAAVARDHGYTGKSEDIKDPLLKSIKSVSHEHPNFGKSDIGWNSWWLKVVQRTFQGLLPDNSQAELIAMKLISEFSTSKCWRLATGTENLLTALKKQEKVIGVISNFDPRLSIILNSLGIFNYFDFVLTSYSAGYSKPDGKIFEMALKKCPIQVEAQNCLHVGDDLYKDYLGAKSAGWNAVLVNEEPMKIEKPPAPKDVFKNVDEVRKAVECKKIFC